KPHRQLYSVKVKGWLLPVAFGRLVTSDDRGERVRCVLETSPALGVEPARGGLAPTQPGAHVVRARHRDRRLRPNLSGPCGRIRPQGAGNLCPRWVWSGRGSGACHVLLRTSDGRRVPVRDGGGAGAASPRVHQS